jgi:hypothetical protein
MQAENWKNYIEKFNQNDEELTKQMIPNEKVLDWIREEVPHFECSDKVIEETYYFRWWVFRKHIKNTDEGRIITEFLPKVSWSGPYNSINCANGHHLSEARWLVKDQSLFEEYLKFWFKGSGNELSYSSWVIYTVYESALITGNIQPAVALLNSFDHFYQEVEERNFTAYGLFWSFDDRDAMEMSISGSGLRPTLNSYMYANAVAISEIAKWAGNELLSSAYGDKAKILKDHITKMLWDPEASFFKVIPQVKREDQIETMDFKHIPKKHNVREAIGYIPWSFGIPGADFDEAWKYVMDDNYFLAPYGPATAEKNHPDYMKPHAIHECLWNGPSWPYATTQILNGMIKVLQDRNCQWLSKQDFLKTLHTYAKSHYRVKENGTVVNWLDENLEPETGAWLSREILKKGGWREDKGGYERGKDYNHSTFCDLVIRGICGVSITSENELVLNPLLPREAWDHFLLENLPYKHHKITIGYDRDNLRYKKGKGMWVEVDGNLVAQTADLDKMIIKL